MIHLLTSHIISQFNSNRYPPISVGISYKLIPRLLIELGVRKDFSNVFVQAEPFLSTSTEQQFKPLTLSLGLSYRLGNTEQDGD